MSRTKTHDLSHCDSCDWQIDGFETKNIGRALQRHADKTGHRVHREIGMVINYRPRRKL